MAGDTGRYLIGRGDGMHGGSLLGIIFNDDPDYQRGLHAGAAHATVGTLRKIASSLPALEQTVREGFGMLAEVIAAGNREISGQLDEANGYLREHLALERAKNTIGDLEPYLTKALAFDDSWFNGKTVSLLRAEREQYAKLRCALGGVYRRIGRLPDISPGPLAIDGLLTGYDDALNARTAELQRLEANAHAALDAACSALLRQNVSPLVVAVALDFGKHSVDVSAPLRTAIIEMDLPYGSRHASPYQAVKSRWTRQSAKTRLDRTGTAVAIFGKWQSAPDTAPPELAKLRRALRALEKVSGELAASARPAVTSPIRIDSRASFLRALLEDGVARYCELVSHMARLHELRLRDQDARSDALDGQGPAKATTQEQIRHDRVERLERTLDAYVRRRGNSHCPSVPTPAEVRAVVDEVTRGPEGKYLVILIGAEAKDTLMRLQSSIRPITRYTGSALLGLMVAVLLVSATNMGGPVGVWIMLAGIGIAVGVAAHPQLRRAKLINTVRLLLRNELRTLERTV